MATGPPCGEGEKILQGQGLSGRVSEATPDLESHLGSPGAGGQPLSQSLRAFFEPRFGCDFGQVRVHTDTQAAESARALKARAFTVGHDLVFGPGQYAPGSGKGKRLLAHELAHTIQQTHAGEVPKTNLQRTIGEGRDLTSPRFAGDPILEACYDDEARLTKGAQGESVRKVQQALIDLGYDLGPTGADGIYGDFTWNAVKKFKADENLGWEYMGDVGPGTMRRLDELFPTGKMPDNKIPDLTCSYFNKVPVLAEVMGGKRSLQKGDNGEAVRRVQQFLISSGYSLPRYGADAKFGDETSSAVSQFQSGRQLNPKGVVDAETLGEMDQHCGDILFIPPDKPPPDRLPSFLCGPNVTIEVARIWEKVRSDFAPPGAQGQDEKLFVSHRALYHRSL